MPRYFRTTALSAACSASAMLLLCGCAGIGASTTASAPAPTPEPAEAVEPAPEEVASTPWSDAPVATSNTTRVTFAEEGGDFDPCVSHDGQWMVFASTQHRATSDVYIKRTNAKVMTQLTNDPADDSMPVFSPDGKRIAFASNRAGNWDIYIMPVTGGKAVQITDDPADELHPSWSPDGKELVYSRQNAGNSRWEMWTTATNNAQTANFIGYGLFPQWCPVAGTADNGGDKILFQLSRERGSRAFAIWTIDYSRGSAGNATQIASETETALINPTWSPDGQWIVFAQADATDGDGRPSTSDLWMVSTEGTGLVRLTSDQAVAFAPTFGPGNRLFFVSNRAGSENVWSMDVTQAIAAASASSGTTVTDAASSPAAETPAEDPGQ